MQVPSQLRRHIGLSASTLALSALTVIAGATAVIGGVGCADAENSPKKTETTKAPAKAEAVKAAAGSTAATAPDTDKASYILGRNMGESFRRDGVAIAPSHFVEGLSSALDGKESKVSQKEVAEVMGELQKQVMEKRQAVAQAAGATNLAAGKAFLEKNRTAEGVVVLPSGLQYKVLKAGEGASPKATDTVVAHYKGTLLNGTEFDSSYGRGTPAEFKVNGLIKGWQEALLLMKPGAKWELVVPADLAYGEQGTGGGPIGPNETLKFDIELIQIKGS